MKAKLIAAITVGTAALLGLTLAAESLASLVNTVEPQRGWRRRGGGFGGMTRAGSPGELSIQNQPQEGKFTFLRLRFDEGTWGTPGGTCSASTWAGTTTTRAPSTTSP